MTKWKVYVLMLIGLLSFSITKASHIVGGEFEFLHKGGDTYVIRLILYSDGNTDGLKPDDILKGLDSHVNIAIYEKATKKIKSRYTLEAIKNLSNKPVEFFLPECSDDYSDVFLAVRFVYELEVTLKPEDYSNPGGYFLLYQRCCRNYSINNIISEDPNLGGIGAGQSFYLEFPPLIKDGERFYNSSPNIFPPISDPACVGQVFWSDFSGSDSDGDSLVYEIATPLNTFSADAYPPYMEGSDIPLIIWENGFSLDNIASGNPDLSIRPDGMIIFKPSFQGLFVFAVKVSEYREGVKIGEVRRDYQIKAIECPPVSGAPYVNIYDKRNNTLYNQGDTLYYQFGESQKCLDLWINDPDPGARVFFTARPLNFTGSISEILPSTNSGTIGPNGEGVNFEVCFEDCPYLREEPFQIEIIAYDNSCPRPLIDSAILTVFIQPPPNTPAQFVDGDELHLTVNQQAGGYFTKSIVATDNDNDQLYMEIIPQGFDPADFGISFEPGRDIAGEIETIVNWDFDCQKYSYDGQTLFPFLIIVDDEDECLFSDPDSINVSLEMILPPNSEPEINISVNNNDNYHFIEENMNSQIHFNVEASDVDNDIILLNGEGVNFDFSSYNIDFDPVQGEGQPGISSSFSWKIPCGFLLAEQDSFRLHFYVEDFDECEITNRDTVVVDIKIITPQTTEPVLNAFPLSNTILTNQQVEMLIGESIELRLVGADSDNDNLTLTFPGIAKIPPAEFSDATGQGHVSSDFFWQPDCRILNGKDSVMIKAAFILADDNCYIPKSDTLTIDILIKDTENLEERFNAPNIITPNNDSKNDYFVLEDIFYIDGTERSMPEDNCSGQFEKIEIYNRWGRKVYESNQRDFKWLPENEPSGMYYFYLAYTNKTFKGHINVLF